MIEIIGTAAEYSEEVIVTTLQWAEIRQVTEVSLTDQRRAVARLLEQRRNVGWLGGKPIPLGVNGVIGSSSPTGRRA